MIIETILACTMYWHVPPPPEEIAQVSAICRSYNSEEECIKAAQELSEYALTVGMGTWAVGSNCQHRRVSYGGPQYRPRISEATRFPPIPAPPEMTGDPDAAEAAQAELKRYEGEAPLTSAPFPNMYRFPQTRTLRIGSP
jgi:hypothetical protein